MDLIKIIDELLNEHDRAQEKFKSLNSIGISRAMDIMHCSGYAEGIEKCIKIIKSLQGVNR